MDLIKYGRKNIKGFLDSINFLSYKQKEKYNLFDYLWNKEEYETLFYELFRLYNKQLQQIIIELFVKFWKIDQEKINNFLKFNNSFSFIFDMFYAAFNFACWEISKNINYKKFKKYIKLVEKNFFFSQEDLGESYKYGCYFFAEIIEKTAIIFYNSELQFDGLSDSSKIKTKDYQEKMKKSNKEIIKDIPIKKWSEFEENYHSLRNSI